MATREEIREGIARIIGDNIGAACSEFGGNVGEETTEEVNQILKYLHFKGVRLLNGEPLIGEE